MLKLLEEESGHIGHPIRIKTGRDLWRLEESEGAVGNPLLELDAEYEKLNRLGAGLKKGL